MVINYVRKKLQFEAVFAWNKDQHDGSTNAYCITFRVSFNNVILPSIVSFGFYFQRGVNQVMIPLNTYITGLHE